MSINGISGITGFGALGPADHSAAPGAGISLTAVAAAAAQPNSGDIAQQAAPARFPWLSRLSRELESAAQQPATFSAAPALGDYLDRSA